MKTYTVLFAQDVPHYGTIKIDAEDDADALERARAYWDRVKSGDEEWPLYDAEHENALLDRIVQITDDSEGYREVACDVQLDSYYLAYAPTGQDVATLKAAPQLLHLLESLITRADDLIAAIEGTTDQFEPEVAALSDAASAAGKAVNAAKGFDQRGPI